VSRVSALAVLAFLILSPRFAHAEAVPINDPWSDLRFLIGEWDTQPTQGLISGHYSLKEDLNGAVLMRRNHAEYAPKPGEDEGIVHDDLMIIYSEGGKHRATFLDPEGHVIHYSISNGNHSATFESDPVPGAPRYKLIYEEKDPGLVKVTFWIAPTGGEYKSYISGTVKRRSS
jgi:hypothetical protein